MAHKEKEEKKQESKEHKEEKTEKNGLSQKDAQITELTDLLKRVQAEFENYKKRVEKEHLHYVKHAEEQLMGKLLPIIDTFELALKNNSDPEKFKKGVELMYAQFMSILQERGLSKIDALGKPFDPYLHEVMITEENDQDNIVLEELQKGYVCNGHVLRHSKVKIGKKGEDGKPESA